MKLFAPNLTGAIAFQALIMAGPNPQYKDLRRSVSGVVFMGTPHRGTNTAAIITKLIRVASIGFSSAVRTQLINGLVADCEMLMDLSEGFRHETIQVITFYEMWETNGLGIVSLPSCACLLDTRGHQLMPYADDIYTPRINTKQAYCRRYSSSRDTRNV